MVASSYQSPVSVLTSERAGTFVVPRRIECDPLVAFLLPIGKHSRSISEVSRRRSHVAEIDACAPLVVVGFGGVIGVGVVLVG